MKGRLFLIDDDSDFLEHTATFLNRAGFQVQVAIDPKKALRLLRQIPTPDAILLDQDMPDMSGLDLLRQLRRRSQTAAIPVFIMSGIPDPDLPLEGFRRGSDDFIPKPVRPEELVLRIDASLRRRVGTDPFEIPANQSPSCRHAALPSTPRAHELLILQIPDRRRLEQGDGAEQLQIYDTISFLMLHHLRNRLIAGLRRGPETVQIKKRRAGLTLLLADPEPEEGIECNMAHCASILHTGNRMLRMNLKRSEHLSLDQSSNSLRHKLLPGFRLFCITIQTQDFSAEMETAPEDVWHRKSLALLLQRLRPDLERPWYANDPGFFALRL